MDTEGSIACEGILSFQSRELQPSLYRNGKAKVERCEDGNSVNFIGLQHKSVPVRLHDGRTAHPAPALDTHGFALLPAAPPTGLDFLHAAQVVARYYPHCEAAVRRATGASHAFAFDHNVRTSGPGAERDAVRGSKQRVQAPASDVHADYTLTSAPERLSQLTRPSKKKNDTHATATATAAAPAALIDPPLLQKASRYGIVNVWRNIRTGGEPVRRNPLVCCAADSVAEDDLVVLEIHYEDRVGENYFIRHNDNQKWFVFPDMTIDEELLLKTWDSAGAFAKKHQVKDRQQSGSKAAEDGKIATFAVHAGLGDYVGKSAEQMAQFPDRWSIEVRVAFLFVEE